MIAIRSSVPHRETSHASEAGQALAGSVGVTGVRGDIARLAIGTAACTTAAGPGPTGSSLAAGLPPACSPEGV